MSSIAAAKLLVPAVALVVVGCIASPAATRNKGTLVPEAETAFVAPSAAPTLTQAQRETASRMDGYLSGLTKEDKFGGSVLIGQRGQILLEKGYGLANREKTIPNTPQTRFLIGSLTKQFTALAILMLSEDGKINLLDPICQYIVDCPAGWRDITIHQTLTHTSGIPDPEPWQIEATEITPIQLIALFKDKPLLFKPGEQFRYSNAGYIVLGQIVEEASGQSYRQFLQQRILLPLKMADTDYDYDPSGLAIAYGVAGNMVPPTFPHLSWTFGGGGLYSTAQDLYRWDQALYTERLVSKSTLGKMFTPSVAAPSGVYQAFLGPNVLWGYDWMTGEYLHHPVIAFGGSINGFNASLLRFPSDSVTIIVLHNYDGVQPGEIEKTLVSMAFGDK